MLEREKSSDKESVVLTGGLVDKRNQIESETYYQSIFCINIVYELSHKMWWK